MTTKIKTATTLELRVNNAFTSIIAVKNGEVVNESTVTPKVFAEFAAGGFRAADWQGRAPFGSADPADYGDLVATYDGTLHIEDEHRWADRVEFYAV